MNVYVYGRQKESLIFDLKVREYDPSPENESQLLEMRMNLVSPGLFLDQNYLAAEAFP